MKKLTLGIVLTFIALNSYAIKINGVVKTLHYMNPNDTVMVADNVGQKAWLRVLYNENMCLIDSNRSNAFGIVKSGKYILQGYSTSGSITLTPFEIKTKLLPPPVSIGMFSFCNATEDTFFMQISKPSDYNKFMQGSFSWYFSNGIQTNNWGVEWQYPTALVGNYKYTCLDKNGNLFKSPNTYITCGNRYFEPTSVNKVLTMLNEQGYICYDTLGREVVPYVGGYFILSRQGITKPIFVLTNE